MKDEAEHRHDYERLLDSLTIELKNNKLEIQKLKTLIIQIENDRDRISHEVIEQRDYYLVSHLNLINYY